MLALLNPLSAFPLTFWPVSNLSWSINLFYSPLSLQTSQRTDWPTSPRRSATWSPWRPWTCITTASGPSRTASSPCSPSPPWISGTHIYFFVSAVLLFFTFSHFNMSGRTSGSFEAVAFWVQWRIHVSEAWLSKQKQILSAGKPLSFVYFHR